MRNLFRTRQDKWRHKQSQEDLSWNKESKIIVLCRSCANKQQVEVSSDGYWSTQCRDYEKASKVGFCKNYRTEEEIKFLGKSW